MKTNPDYSDQGHTPAQREGTYKIMFVCGILLFCIILYLVFTK